MFGESLMSELTRPQHPYSSGSVRDMYDRLAHSSIMRLSKASMDKLYDLMTMGLKYQLLHCPSPGALHDITMNHLDAMAAMVGASPSAQASVQRALQCIEDLAGRLTPFDYGLVRQRMLSFLQDISLKVSIFIARRLQDRDTGDIHVSVAEHDPLPPGFDTPGLVRYYGAGAGAGTGGGHRHREVRMQRPLCHMCTTITATATAIDGADSSINCDSSTGHAQPVRQRTSLGSNMYTDYKSSSAGVAGPQSEERRRSRGHYSLHGARETSSQRAHNPELAVMASMLGGSTATGSGSGSGGGGKMTYSFGDTYLLLGAEEQDGATDGIDLLEEEAEGGGRGGHVVMTVHPAEGRGEYLRGLWGGGRGSEGESYPGRRERSEEEDLLDLLDEVG